VVGCTRGPGFVKSHGETVGLIFEPGDARGELSEFDTGEVHSLDLVILGAHTIRPQVYPESLAASETLHLGYAS
jgi:hypothetical protein